MQTLGLSDSTPRSESRLKSLFWPSISNGSDVDYLGTQGYWLCTLVAVVSFVFSLLQRQPIVAVVVLLFYYFGGVGVRERSVYAAIVIALMFITDTVLGGLSVPKVIFSALLLSNVRATWIASQWRPESEEAIQPPRLNETFADRLSDQWPMWLWPRAQILYYIFSFAVVAAVGWWLIHRDT